jgi:D-glycero-D-manno-heptose 1,7-bisphosphate phosphatase
MGISNLSLCPAVFLDRDGVLNRAFLHEDGKTHPPASPGQLEILPGVVQACQALRRANFLLIVVTNQPDVARGVQDRTTVHAINDKLRHLVPIDDIRVCFHDDADNCNCRKPKPGLLLQAARIWGIDLSKSYMVGDRWKDIRAGQLAGCTTIGVHHDHSELERCRPDFLARSLQDAASWIVNNTIEK